jgi:Skp family chaperone for outer membrane proteins
MGSEMKPMRKNIFIILSVIMVISTSMLTACTSQENTPDPRLIELRQLKLEQIEQINAELAGLQAEIQGIESELAKPVEMKALSNLTAEKIATSIKRPGLEARLKQLKEQESDLLARKQYLEEDLKGIDALLEEE